MAQSPSFGSNSVRHDKNCIGKLATFCLYAISLWNKIKARFPTAPLTIHAFCVSNCIWFWNRASMTVMHVSCAEIFPRIVQVYTCMSCVPIGGDFQTRRNAKPCARGNSTINFGLFWNYYYYFLVTFDTRVGRNAETYLWEQQNCRVNFVFGSFVVDKQSKATTTHFDPRSAMVSVKMRDFKQILINFMSNMDIEPSPE